VLDNNHFLREILENEAKLSDYFNQLNLPLKLAIKALLSESVVTLFEQDFDEAQQPRVGESHFMELTGLMQFMFDEGLKGKKWNDSDVMAEYAAYAIDQVILSHFKEGKVEIWKASRKVIGDFDGGDVLSSESSELSDSSSENEGKENEDALDNSKDDSGINYEPIEGVAAIGEADDDDDLVNIFSLVK